MYVIYICYIYISSRLASIIFLLFWLGCLWPRLRAAVSTIQGPASAEHLGDQLTAHIEHTCTISYGITMHIYTPLYHIISYMYVSLYISYNISSTYICTSIL